MKTTALALALSWLLIPALAGAAPKSSFITDRYAKQLVVKKITDQFGQHGRGWQVKLINGTSPGSKRFNAAVKWGPGPHIMIALPDPSGLVNMLKSKKAPQGPARVKILSPILPNP